MQLLVNFTGGRQILLPNFIKHATAMSDHSAATYLKAYNAGLEIYTAARPGRKLVPIYEIAGTAITTSFITTL